MKYEIKYHHSTEPILLVDKLALLTGASKSLIKRAMLFGGCWVRGAGQKALKRCRKAKALLKPGDYLEFYVETQLLEAPIPEPIPILETAHWGIWFKPVNQVSQGSRFGDANCLEVCVARLRKAPVFLVHRLDREACGLVLLAYSSAAAAQLSQLWSTQTIEKYYQARVLGLPEPMEGNIKLDLDGKAAHTQYRVAGQASAVQSWIDIRLHTGRLHQIRRHMAAIGHPLMGDPEYGEGNGFGAGLQLAAVELRFVDPCQAAKPSVICRLPPQWCLF